MSIRRFINAWLIGHAKRVKTKRQMRHFRRMRAMCVVMQAPHHSCARNGPESVH